jgi:hypothetical protein
MQGQKSLKTAKLFRPDKVDSVSVIKSRPVKNVEHLSMPENVPLEASFHLKMLSYTPYF